MGWFQKEVKYIRKTHFGSFNSGKHSTIMVYKHFITLEIAVPNVGCSCSCGPASSDGGVLQIEKEPRYEMTSYLPFLYTSNSIVCADVFLEESTIFLALTCFPEA